MSRPLPFRRAGTGPSSPGPLFRLPGGDIVCADALRFLQALPEGCADVILLDPPFNLGKSYDRATRSADRLGDDAYFAYMWQILRRSAAVLRPGGSLFLYHVPRWASRFAPVLASDLMFRHWIAISMKNGFARGDSLYPAHYALLYFTKGKPRSFRRPKIRPAECPHCRRLVKDYGGYERFIANGINLSDVWDDLSPVRHAKHKHREENELPQEIPSRVLQIASRPGGLFVDAFAGAGTSLVLAAKAGMIFLGCDRQLKHCRLMVHRIRQTIKRREGKQ